LEGVSRTAQVSVALVGSDRGEEEMLYCRIRIGGNIARNWPNDKVADGNRTSRSRQDRRLNVTSLTKMSPARASSFALSDASVVDSAILIMFYES